MHNELKEGGHTLLGDTSFSVSPRQPWERTALCSTSHYFHVGRGNLQPTFPTQICGLGGFNLEKTAPNIIETKKTLWVITSTNCIQKPILWITSAVTKEKALLWQTEDQEKAIKTMNRGSWSDKKNKND